MLYPPPRRSSTLITSVEGHGPNLVLIHGVGSDSRAWLRMAPYLVDNFRLISIDIPGVSMLRLSETFESLPIIAERLQDDLNSEGIESFSLVGHSLGGSLAALVALGFPESVPSLSLIAPGGFGPEINPALRAMTGRSARAVLRFTHRPRVKARVSRFAERYERTSERAGSVREVMDLHALLATDESQLHFQTSLKQVMKLRRNNTSDLHSMLQVPMQLLWGEKDLILPAWQSQRAAQQLGACAVHILPDAGHAPHKSHPMQLAKYILGFAQQQSIEGSGPK